MLEYSNDLCTCTHPRGSHTSLSNAGPYVPGCGNCWAGSGKLSERHARARHEFKRDNLRYLEQLSEKTL